MRRGLSYVKNLLFRCFSRHVHPHAQTCMHKTDTVITRDEFEKEVDELIERALTPVKRVLENTSMRPDEIDEVVMVGGSSRIPRIRQAVSEFFGGLELKQNIDPDLAVAIGAASILD